MRRRKRKRCDRLGGGRFQAEEQEAYRKRKMREKREAGRERLLEARAQRKTKFPFEATICGRKAIVSLDADGEIVVTYPTERSSDGLSLP